MASNIPAMKRSSLTKSPEKAVLVTGANGFIGRHLIDSLSQQSQSNPIIAGVRSIKQCNARQSRAWNNAVECLEIGDISDLQSFGRQLDLALSRCESVVHLAGIAHNRVKNDAEFTAINVEPCLYLAQRAAAAGVKRFIFVSSIAVYGRHSNRAPWSENTPVQPTTAYGRSKLEAEIGLQAIAESTSMEVVILRPALTYAGDAPANMADLLRLSAKGLPLPFARKRGERSLLYIKNLVDFIRLCISKPDLKTNVYNIADAESLTIGHIVATLQKGMQDKGWDTKVQQFYCPHWLLKLVLNCIGKQQVYEQLFLPLQVDTSKAQRDLNWAPPVSAEAGLYASGQQYVSVREGA